LQQNTFKTMFDKVVACFFRQVGISNYRAHFYGKRVLYITIIPKKHARSHLQGTKERYNVKQTSAFTFWTSAVQLSSSICKFFHCNHCFSTTWKRFRLKWVLFEHTRQVTYTHARTHAPKSFQSCLGCAAHETLCLFCVTFLAT